MEKRDNIYRVIVFIIALVLLVWMLTACCPCRHLTASTQDSLHIEVTERIVEVRDTVYFEVEKDSQAVTTQDTTSFLENAYAVSRVSIVNGSLYHYLSTKPRTWNIPFTIPTIRRDSTVFRNFYRTEVVEVERDYTWWDKTQIGGFWVMIIALAILLLWRRIKAKVGLFL
jgi:hypothetical protein